jgi:hypothetical protein
MIAPLIPCARQGKLVGRLRVNVLAQKTETVFRRAQALRWTT